MYCDKEWDLYEAVGAVLKNMEIEKCSKRIKEISEKLMEKPNDSDLIALRNTFKEERKYIEQRSIVSINDKEVSCRGVNVSIVDKIKDLVEKEAGTLREKPIFIEDMSK